MNHSNIQDDPLVNIARSILDENSKYYKGLGNSTVDKRKAHFAKQTKMSDSDDDAYKPAPGDASAETKVSKYTKAYAAMYGEESVDDENSAEEELTEESKLPGLEKKSEKSGIAYGILKQVYDRGMAAWKTGHRPGANQQQWAYARVNSFIVGGKTRTTTDADLWAKHSK